MHVNLHLNACLRPSVDILPPKCISSLITNKKLISNLIWLSFVFVFLRADDLNQWSIVAGLLDAVQCRVESSFSREQPFYKGRFLLIVIGPTCVSKTTMCPLFKNRLKIRRRPKLQARLKPIGHCVLRVQ